MTWARPHYAPIVEGWTLWNTDVQHVLVGLSSTSNMHLFCKSGPAFLRPNEFISCLRRTRSGFLSKRWFVNLMINGFEPHGEQNLCIAISLLMDHVMEAGIALISWLPGQ